MDEPQVPRQSDADGGEAADRSCPWCGAAVPTAAATCAACGAAVAQRESIGDLQIPGLTSVDPALQDFDNRPLHLRGPSASQGVAPAMIVGAMAGGPIGLAAIGGVAAVAAAEYLGAGRGGAGGTRIEDVGKPSEVVLQALRSLDEETAPDGHADAATADDGSSIWRDLPRPATQDESTTEEAG